MPSWVWILLAALVIAAAVAIPLLVRSSRRGTWRSELADAEREVGWYAHDLLPTLLRTSSADELRGAWDVGRPRVTAVEQRLAALTESAPTDADRLRAEELHTAVQQTGEQISRLAAGGEPDIQHGLAVVAADLDTALGGAPSP